MHRLPFQHLLEKYRPLDKEEEWHRDRTLSFVAEHSDCFERSCVPGHITGSAWLLNRSGTHVLLTHHRKLNAWFQTGGHCDGDSNVLDVALREAQEESGIQNVAPISEDIFNVDVHPIPERPGEPAHYHYDINFLIRTMDDSPFVVSEESYDLKWFSCDESHFPFSSPSMKRMFHKWERWMDENRLK